jgi:hypothetical protein
MLVGSCFSSEIGDKFTDGKMNVCVNPSGTIYNPASIANCINRLITATQYGLNELVEYNDRWISLDHYTGFESDDKNKVLNKINGSLIAAHNFLKGASFLFITFGTSKIYRWKESGKVVANCHKIPSKHFTEEMISPSEILEIWSNTLRSLVSFNPKLKVIFTVSPVRHWKDGAHTNQLSKSVLFVAINELMEAFPGAGYFPSYELVMDDLRDYRFYANDMLHPSPQAVGYIWDALSKCYFDKETLQLYNEIESVTRASRHRLKDTSGREVEAFVKTMLSKIDKIKSSSFSPDLSAEENYFQSLLKL